MFSFCNCYPYFFAFEEGTKMTGREKKGERERFEGERKNIPRRICERERKEQERPLFASSHTIFYPAWLQRRFKALLSLRPENSSPVSFSGGSGWGGCCCDPEAEPEAASAGCSSRWPIRNPSKIHLLATTEAQIVHALCSRSAKWDTQGSISRENQWCKNAFQSSVISSWDAHDITFYCFDASVAILV